MSQKPKHYISDIPELMAEWNWEMNNELELDPNEITYGSGKKVWWKCSKGHEWQARVGHRTAGHGCPMCAHQRLIEGSKKTRFIKGHIPHNKTQ